MKVISVWRIEDADGIGPYRSTHKDISRTLMNYCEAPVMYAMIRDRGFNKRRFNNMCKNGWKFAWVSQELALEHCGDNLEALKSLGFTVKKISVSRYRALPDGQVMYKN